MRKQFLEKSGRGYNVKKIYSQRMIPNTQIYMSIRKSMVSKPPPPPPGLQSSFFFLSLELSTALHSTVYHGRYKNADSPKTKKNPPRIEEARETFVPLTGILLPWVKKGRIRVNYSTVPEPKKQKQKASRIRHPRNYSYISITSIVVAEGPAKDYSPSLCLAGLFLLFLLWIFILKQCCRGLHVYPSLKQIGAYFFWPRAHDQSLSFSSRIVLSLSCRAYFYFYFFSREKTRHQRVCLSRGLPGVFSLALRTKPVLEEWAGRRRGSARRDPGVEGF